MEKEREEIKRLLQSTTTTTTTSTQSSSRPLQAAPQTPSKRKRHHTQLLHSPRKRQPPALLPPQIPVAKSTRSHTHSKQENSSLATTRSAPILRANYDLESSRPLEELLQRREADLRKRREHVERLMEWHQRLDQEEAEVLQLERMVYNNAHAAPPTPTIADSKSPNRQTHNPEKSSPHQERSTKMERRLKEIDKSLRELSGISSSNSTIGTNAAGTGQNNEESAIDSVDFVRTTGIKLNKLWRRLTSQQIEKFEPNRRYKLCKPDLERLYEEAKIAVLRDFALDEERITAELLEKSASSSHRSSPVPRRAAQPDLATLNRVEVPCLNLNFSSGQSEQEEEESVAAASMNSLPQGNYSPSAAEEDFNMRSNSSDSKSSSSLASESELNDNAEAPTPPPPSKSSNSVDSAERSKQIERNKLKFLELTQRRDIQNASTGVRLQRSLSDTEINEMPLQSNTQHAQAAANVTPLSQFIVVSHSRTRSSPISIEGGNPSSASASASDTLKNLQSIQSQPTQTSQHTSNNIEVASIPSAQQSSAGSNNVKSSLSKSTISGSATFKNTDNFPNSSEESLNNTSTLAKQRSSESNKEMLQARQNSVICSVGKTSETRTNSNHTASTAASASSSIPTQALTNMSTFSGQFSSVDSGRKAREISAKLEQISAAVTQLSQSNSLLPTYQSTKTRNASATTSPPTTSVINDESNQSVEEASYSCHFENISTDMHSPSGCTLKGSSSTNSAGASSATHINSNHSPKEDGGPSIGEGSSTKSSNDTSTSSPVVQSKTFICEPNPLSQTSVEEKILDAYEADFESTGDETHLDDITLPQFDSTVETTQEEEGDKSLPQENTSSVEEEKPGNKASVAPPPPPPPPPPSATQTTSSNETGSTHLMPDIINELEIRRCQQILLETEQLKQLYVREIPNKPPPPYVPPAHGSPMTTIFPSGDRIKDITYRRTHELYCEILKTDYTNEKGEKLPTVMEEKITNIYERIILDICREYMLINMSPSPPKDPLNFHSQLAFFNPPDRLRCIQASIYKEVRRCLAMDKTPPKRTQVYSVYGQRRDHIGKIIIQEMYDEDDKWCNFHREENEVLELILEEMIVNDVRKLAREELIAEGGTVDLEDATTDEWEEETSNVEEPVVVVEAEKTSPPVPEETVEPSSASNSDARVELMASSINDTASNKI